MNKIKFAVIIFIIGGIIMYTRVNWQNAPSTATPVNAENLNIMDKGIADAHSQLAQMDKGIADAHSQLAQKANQEFVNQQIANVASGTPKGAFETLQQLQNAHPTGTTGIFVISADGKWYYWNNSSWVPGGIYQSTLWQNALTTQNQSWEV